MSWTAPVRPPDERAPERQLAHALHSAALENVARSVTPPVEHGADDDGGGYRAVAARSYAQAALALTQAYVTITKASSPREHR